MEEVFALALEARGAVGHHALALRGADLAAEVGFAGLAELALAAFGRAVVWYCVSVRIFPFFFPSSSRVWEMIGEEGSVLKCDDVVSWFHGSDTLSYGLDDAGAFVPEDDWKGTLWVLAGECVGIFAFSAAKFCASTEGSIMIPV